MNALDLYPLGGKGVTFDPEQVLDSFVYPTVGAYWLLTTTGMYIRGVYTPLFLEWKQRTVEPLIRIYVHTPLIRMYTLDSYVHGA